VCKVSRYNARDRRLNAEIGLPKGGRRAKASPIRRSPQKTPRSQRNDGFDDSLIISGESTRWQSVTSLPESAEAWTAGQVHPTNPTEQSPFHLPLNLLPQWTQPGYEMKADELCIMADLLNQLSTTLDLRHICIPWFYVAGHFEGSHFSISNCRRSEKTWEMHSYKNLDEKKVRYNSRNYTTSLSHLKAEDI
jgi:hypothetical protein